MFTKYLMKHMWSLIVCSYIVIYIYVGMCVYCNLYMHVYHVPVFACSELETIADSL